MTIQVPILTCPRAALHTPDMLFSIIDEQNVSADMVALTYDWDGVCSG